MNLWTMLGVVVLIYGVIAVILVSNMRVDLKTPWKGLRGAQEQAKISDFDWVEIAGICEDTLSVPNKKLGIEGDLSQSYVVSQVSGVTRCVEICKNVHGCVAFSLSDSGSCFVTTECITWSPSLLYITYIKREVAANIKQESSVRIRAHTSPKHNDVAADGGPADDGCSYCPNQNPCEQPRLCRAGQCFHNLKIKDGTACDAGDPVRIGDVCINGICTPPNRGFHLRR